MNEEDVLSRLRELETHVAIIETKLDQTEKNLGEIKGGFNKGLWFIGGSFISGIMAWIVSKVTNVGAID